MKYNSLNEFEIFLLSHHTPATAQTYKKAMDFLLKEQYLFDCKKLDVEKVIQKLKVIKYKNQYSKYKNAFLKYCSFIGLELDEDTRLELSMIRLEKKKKRRQLKQVELKDILNHLKVMRDKKLKCSFETMLHTGLRVSELSQIQKENCTIETDYIEFDFLGKGGNQERVVFYEIQNQQLFEDLKNLISNTTGKVFY